MKAFFTLILTIGVVFMVNAQNVPNGNFEGPPFTWFGANGGVLKIGGKFDAIQPNGDTLILKSFAGMGAALMVNTDNAAGLNQNFAIAIKPDSFVFQYNFIPFGNDVAGATIVLTRFDAKLGIRDTLLNETAYISDTVSIDYKRVAYYLGDKYKMVGSPDSGSVHFSPSTESGAETKGSYLALDDIDLVASGSSAIKALSQNVAVSIMPNPVFDVASIAYSLDRNELVNIELCDINGRGVLTVLNAEQNAGSHQSEMDVSGLASGVYYCKVKIGHAVAIQKIVVSR